MSSVSIPPKGNVLTPSVSSHSFRSLQEFSVRTSNPAFVPTDSATYVIARAIAKHQASNTNLMPSVIVTDESHLDNINNCCVNISIVRGSSRLKFREIINCLILLFLVSIIISRKFYTIVTQVTIKKNYWNTPVSAFMSLSQVVV